MSLTLQEKPGTKILEVDLSGKLSREDYERFTPEVESRIRQYGKVRILVEMHDFDGWTMGAFWEEVKFDVKHFRDVERVAFVGNEKWEKNMSKVCRPFTTAEIRFFPPDQKDAARSWLES